MRNDPLSNRWTIRRTLYPLLALLPLGCSPTVKVEAPTDPIVIHLNVKIEHEIRVRLEKGVDKLIAGDQQLF